MTRKTSFYYSFLVLPKAKREVIVAVWDFCRAVDDAVDLESDPVTARAALDEWRREVDRVFAGAPVTRQGIALQTLAAPFTLPREQFDALIDGVGMDIAPQRFQTFAELAPYCLRVASSVGLICAEIFGYRDPVVRESLALQRWPHSVRPENLVLLVAGGGHPTNSYWMEGYSPHVVGRKINVPADFARLLEQADRDIGCGAEACRI